MKFLLYIAVIAATGWAGWYSHQHIAPWMQERIDSRKSAEEKKINSAINEAAQKERLTSARVGVLQRTFHRKICG